MINFDAVDFSERRSEEVKSFFWRLVYINLPRTKTVEWVTGVN